MAFARINNIRLTPKMTFGGAASGALGGASMGASFGPWGALIGAAVGGVSGAITSGEQKKKDEADQARLAADRLAQERSIKEDYSRAVLSTYPSKGVSGTSYFGAMGGKMPIAIPPAPLEGRVVTSANRYLYGGSTTLAVPIHDNAYTIGNRPITVQGTAPVKPPTRELGGNLIPLASNAQIVKGDTHNQDTNRDGKTGVTLKDGHGQDAVEVENNEVLIGDKVFSHRLGYASVAKQLADKKGELEKSLSKSGSVYHQGTVKRNIEKVNSDVDNLFAHQEKFKADNGLVNPNEGTPQATWGGWNSIFNKDSYVPDSGGTDSVTGEYTPGIKIPGGGEQRGWVKGVSGLANAALPLIDNLTNAKLNRNTPQIPKPLHDVAAPLKTTININPQLGELQDTQTAYAKDINQHTSNSAVANAAKAGMYAKMVTEKNKLLGYKENAETELKNKDVLNQQDVLSRNISKENDYNYQNMMRTADIQDRTSKNVANATNDFVQAKIDTDYRNLDLQKMKINAQAASLDNDAALAQTFDQMIRAGVKYTDEELMNISVKSKRGREIIAKYRPDLIK